MDFIELMKKQVKDEYENTDFNFCSNWDVKQIFDSHIKGPFIKQIETK